MIIGLSGSILGRKKFSSRRLSNDMQTKSIWFERIHRNSFICPSIQVFKHKKTSIDAWNRTKYDLCAVHRDGWMAYQTLLPNTWKPTRLRDIDIN